MSKDLRSWIGDLKTASLLYEINKPVDRLTQMGALIYESDKSLLFHDVVDYPGWRVYSQGAVTRTEIDLVHRFTSSETYLVAGVWEVPLPLRWERSKFYSPLDRPSYERKGPCRYVAAFMKRCT